MQPRYCLNCRGYLNRNREMVVKFILTFERFQSVDFFIVVHTTSVVRLRQILDKIALIGG